MEPISILKNSWVKNGQYFGTDWLDVEVAGKRIRLYWCFFPSNDAAVVLDHDGHPLAYFNSSAREGVSPVKGFNGQLPRYFDGINYINEELKLVGSQLELLLNWPGWKAERLSKALENPGNILSDAQLKNLLRFYRAVIMDSNSSTKLNPAFNIDIKSAFNSEQ